MKTFIYIFFNIISVLITCLSALGVVYSQTDTLASTKPTEIYAPDSILNMDAVYARPFLELGKSQIAIGGYTEASLEYSQSDGISEGLSFVAKRTTLFLSSSITSNIRFLSEIEFEDGTKEINIEFAAMDIEFHPLLTLRGGIILNPIGAFNQNHDGPKWDFIERPISATTIIPSTLSSVGLGIYGKHFYNNWVFGYEMYLTNGFDDRIISNEDNRTSLRAGKINPARFEENFSGLPMFTGKLAVRNRQIGEIGFSYMTGVYNKWQDDGLILDDKRSINVVALDFNITLFNNRLSILGEFAKVFVDVPRTYTQAYASEQFGFFIDVVETILQHQILNWEKAQFNLGIRLEYADYNQEVLNETGTNIADDVWAIVPSLAFRPTGSAVLRINYRFERQRDLLGNPPEKTTVFQIGFSTYF